MAYTIAYTISKEKKNLESSILLTIRRKEKRNGFLCRKRAIPCVVKETELSLKSLLVRLIHTYPVDVRDGGRREIIIYNEIYAFKVYTSAH